LSLQTFQNAQVTQNKKKSD
jgi:hypothetical protein